MTTQFNKVTANQSFDNSLYMKEMFFNIGYKNVNVRTCTTNGISNYITLDVEVLNENKLYHCMWVNEDNTVTITVRISDHLSNLETRCNGVSGNKLTIDTLNKLIITGAIKATN